MPSVASMRSRARELAGALGELLGIRDAPRLHGIQHAAVDGLGQVQERRAGTRHDVGEGALGTAVRSPGDDAGAAHDARMRDLELAGHVGAGRQARHRGGAELGAERGQRGRFPICRRRSAGPPPSRAAAPIQRMLRGSMLDALRCVGGPPPIHAGGSAISSVSSPDLHDPSHRSRTICGNRGPDAGNSASRLAGSEFDRHPVDQPGQRQHAPPSAFTTTEPVSPSSTSISERSGGKAICTGGSRKRPDARLVGCVAEPLQRWRQVSARREQRAGRRRRQRRAACRQAGEGIEQDRRRSHAAGQPGVAAPSGRPTQTAMVWRPS